MPGKSQQRPWKITIKLDSPVAAEGLIHLDGLLVAAAGKTGGGGRLPLSRREARGFMIHTASAAHIIGPDGQPWAKYFTRQDDGAAMLHHRPLELIFWARGHGPKIVKMLEVLGAIGADTAAGWGAVASVDAARMDEDWSVFRGAPRWDIPTRAIPVDAGWPARRGAPQAEHAYWPPYHAGRRALCWLPPKMGDI